MSRDLERLLTGREVVIAARGDKDFVSATDSGMEEIAAEAIAPIVCEGDVIGAVMLLGKDEKASMGETEKKLALTAASFLGRQMEG